MEFVGRHPCWYDGSAYFFFLDVETFAPVIILLLLLSNINVFSLLRTIPTFKNCTRRVFPHARRYDIFCFSMVGCRPLFIYILAFALQLRKIMENVRVNASTYGVLLLICSNGLEARQWARKDK